MGPAGRIEHQLRAPVARQGPRSAAGRSGRRGKSRVPCVADSCHAEARQAQDGRREYLRASPVPSTWLLRRLCTTGSSSGGGLGVCMVHIVSRRAHAKRCTRTTVSDVVLQARLSDLNI